MLLRHKLSTLLTLCTLSACGFTPVYQDTGDEHSVSSKLKTVTVEKINGGIKGVKLRTALEDIFNPGKASAWKHYTLAVHLTQKREAVFIERNRDIDRYNISMTGKFTLTDKATGKVIYKDKSRLTNGYNVIDSDYATLASQEDTENRILQELSRDISLKLSDFFLREAADKAQQ